MVYDLKKIEIKKQSVHHTVIFFKNMMVKENVMGKEKVTVYDNY